MPEVYKQLTEIFELLEKHYKDMQDFEFTIQEGKLYMLQTRSGKRTGAGRRADRRGDGERGADQREEGADAGRIRSSWINSCTQHQLQSAQAACSSSRWAWPPRPGAAVGRVVFTADDAEEWNERGRGRHLGAR